ncbi:hypothetical protein V7127_22670 [Bacillus sp. JJ1773]|uniref:hypothetical protein n=1 Tax=Bacillus sp. JJ1773 TaxID=3122965 RepID=UPI002FFEF1C1
MKKIIYFLIFSAFIFFDSEASAEGYPFNKGDYVKLNGYEFRVLDPTTNYIHSVNNLENRAFSGNDNNFSTTENGNIGKYLNNEFLGNLAEFEPYIEQKLWQGSVPAKIGLISTGEYRNNRSLFPLNGDGSIWWTLTKSSYSTMVYVILANGREDYLSRHNNYGVKPSLYLKPGLLFEGSGSKSEPYILKVEELPDVSNIENLSLLKSTFNSLLIGWTNPLDELFSHAKILLNGNVVADNFKDDKYEFTKLNPNQTYEIQIIAVAKDHRESNGITMRLTTDDIPILPEVVDLNSKVNSNEVQLNWKNPQHDYFNSVKIYRKNFVKEQQTALNKILIGQKVSAADVNGEYKPMFETNGTMWKDLTVDPESKYEYKVTTLNTVGAESEGVIIQAETPKAPLPELEGGGYKKDENGDFLFTWTSPTKGKIKILIDGKGYKTVEASLKQILIPKEDMKYDIFNNPKVALVPISEDGKEGTPTKPGESGGIGAIGGGKIPFGPTDLLKSVMGLLGVIAPILLLSLAIIFFKPIKNVIVKAVQNRRGREMYR